MANTYDLNGRIAVVTGGAQGFGRAVAERFAQSGAKVDIWDMDIALAEKTAGEIGAGVRAIKTASTDLDNAPLLQEIAASGLPMIVSTGAARASMSAAVTW